MLINTGTAIATAKNTCSFKAHILVATKFLIVHGKSYPCAKPTGKCTYSSKHPNPTHPHTRTCTHTYTHTHTHAHTHTHTHTMAQNTHTHAHTQTHTHSDNAHNAHKHTHTHTHAHSCEHLVHHIHTLALWGTIWATGKAIIDTCEHLCTAWCNL